MLQSKHKNSDQYSVSSTYTHSPSGRCAHRDQNLTYKRRMLKSILLSGRGERIAQHTIGYLNLRPLAPHSSAEVSTSYHSVYCVYYLHKTGKKASIISIVSNVSTLFAHELHTKIGKATRYGTIFNCNRN